MTLFFASAFLTLAVAALGIEGRAVRRRVQAARAAGVEGHPRRRRAVADWSSLSPGWRAAIASALVALVSSGIIIDSLDPLTSLSWATWLSGPATTQVMAGCLAGTALAWGLARIHTVTSLSWTGLAEVGATLVVPIAVFIVAVAHADPRSAGSQRLLGGLRSLEIGGLAKVELAAASASIASPQPEVQRQLIPVSGGSSPGNMSRPHLNVLSDYSPQNGAGQAADNVYSRDRQILLFLGGAQAAGAGAETWRHQREFLERFRPLLDCIAAYVGQSKDRSMIAVTLAPSLLHLAMLERGWRNLKVEKDEAVKRERRAALNGGYADFASSLLTPVYHMRQYITAAGRGSAECSNDAVLAPLEKPWDFGGGSDALSPHLAIFAAWSFSGVGSYELAIQTLSEWLDQFRAFRKGADGEVRAHLRWFELRALMEMAQIAYVHERNASESRTARRILNEVLEVMDETDGIPALDQFGRDRRPRCAAQAPSEVQRKLLLLRSELSNRFLHAIIDNEDRDRELGVADLELARRLRELDLDCLPKPQQLEPMTRQAYEAIFRGTYARVAWTWAAKAERNRTLAASAADEMRGEARREARAAMAVFTGADADWRGKNQCADCSLGERFERDIPFAADMARVKALWLDLAAATE